MRKPMLLFLAAVGVVAALLAMVLARLPRPVVVVILVMSILGVVASKVVPPICQYRTERLKRGVQPRGRRPPRKRKPVPSGLRVIQGTQVVAQHRI